MDEVRIDLRKIGEDERQKREQQEWLLFQLNHTFYLEPGYKELMRELFAGKIGENSFVKAPLSGAELSNISIGNGVYVNSNLLAMARGGIVIEDDVQIAANVQLITNNHDLYDRQALTCQPIVLKKGAWIGAGVTILPGITIGKYAVIGAASVVTHDVGDYEVVVGNPAKCIKRLEPEKFEV